MNQKLFISLVIILSILIICASAWLVMSIIDYNKVTNPNDTAVDTNLDTTQDDEVYAKPVVENNKIINNSQYILPSDSRELTRSELEELNLDTLNKAYNEIFARHGHDFKSKELKVYFDAQPWYKAVPEKTVAVSELSALEYKNMELIKTIVNELKK